MMFVCLSTNLKVLVKISRQGSVKEFFAASTLPFRHRQRCYARKSNLCHDILQTFLSHDFSSWDFFFSSPYFWKLHKIKFAAGNKMRRRKNSFKNILCTLFSRSKHLQTEHEREKMVVVVVIIIMNLTGFNTRASHSHFVSCCQTYSKWAENML